VAAASPARPADHLPVTGPTSGREARHREKVGQSGIIVAPPPRQEQFDWPRGPRLNRTKDDAFGLCNQGYPEASPDQGEDRVDLAHVFNRSMLLRRSLFGAVRRRTLICWRSTRISTSSFALGRNRSTSTHQVSLQRSHIRRQHRPIRDHLPDEVCDRHT
jgi:hypothetical protein